MKKQKSRNFIVMSLGLLLAAVGLLTYTVYAWFAGGDQAGMTVVTGDVDLDVAIYLGNDADKDGILEPIDPSAAEPVSRAQRLGAYYEPLSREELRLHGDMAITNCLTFKIIVENRSDSDILAEVALSNLDAYVFNREALENFLSAYDPNNPDWAVAAALVGMDTGINSLFDGLAARTAFRLEAVSACFYAKDEGENSLSAGYGTPSAQAGVDIPDRYLWEFSNGENFLTTQAGARVGIAAGELMELEFRLTYLQVNDELYSRYTAYAQANYVQRCAALVRSMKLGPYAQAGMTEEEQAREALDAAGKYVAAFVREEQRYLARAQFEGDDDTGEAIPDNRLSIERFYVKGIQQPQGK